MPPSRVACSPQLPTRPRVIAASGRCRDISLSWNPVGREVWTQFRRRTVAARRGPESSWRKQITGLVRRLLPGGLKSVGIACRTCSRYRSLHLLRSATAQLVTNDRSLWPGGTHHPSHAREVFAVLMQPQVPANSPIAGSSDERRAVGPALCRPA